MKSRPKLTDAEFEIMEVVWDIGETNVNEVNKLISQKRGEELSRTTTQVQMRRLEVKGWLKHRKVQRNFYYSATINRQESSEEIVTDIRERVFGGSVSSLVKCLFKSDKINAEEVAELRKIIENGDWQD